MAPYVSQLQLLASFGSFASADLARMGAQLATSDTGLHSSSEVLCPLRAQKRRPGTGLGPLQGWGGACDSAERAAAWWSGLACQVGTERM